MFTYFLVYFLNGKYTSRSFNDYNEVVKETSYLKSIGATNIEYTASIKY